tara:strand:- start:230 stop:928 length:699 start_codon:yes stop_codon:yes gene_type:complete
MPLDFEILGQGVYTPSEAARLIGGTPQQVLRWTRGSGASSPLWDAHFQFIENSTEISFLDLIEIRVVEAMRRHGISLQAIRFAIKIAQEKYSIERPLASQNFKADGQEILMDAIEGDGEYVSLSSKRPGQKVFRDIVAQSLKDLEYEGDTVARWRPMKFKQVVIDPTRFFGDPILDDSSISTSTIYAEFKIFGDVKYLSRIYEVPVSAIKQAIRFETSLEKAAERPNGQSPI